MKGAGFQAHRYTAAGGIVQLATKLGVLDIATSQALAVNDAGWIVGTATGTTGGNRAFLYTESLGMLDLNTVLTNGSNLTLRYATAISDNGFIAGYGTSSVDGQEHAFLLAPPIAEGAPDAAGTFGLMALALTGLVAVRRRAQS
jgi:probable HAF family extracellular repeat protein